MALRVIGGLAGLTAVTSSLYAYLTGFRKEITVAEKFTRVRGDGHIYSLSDTDNQVYLVNRSLWYWQWYPAELWTSLKPGQTYRIKGYGVRNGFLQLYPNIIAAHALNSGLPEGDNACKTPSKVSPLYLQKLDIDTSTMTLL